MKKRIFITLFLLAISTFAFVNGSTAGENWKQEQAEMFSKIPVKPGDIVDTSNWEKVSDLLPPSMVDWVKKGDLIVKIGEMKYDLGNGPTWEKTTSENDGKYDLDEILEVIDKSTGKYPPHIKAEPFPNIDWKADPNAGIKIMHNNLALQGAFSNFSCVGSNIFVGRKGYEKGFVFKYSCNFFWGREKEIDNPEKLLVTQLVKILAPYEIRDMVTLNKRALGPDADEYYAYVPSIRRVKKLSPASRSESSFGSDFVNDDSNGWAGKNTSMKWKVIDYKTSLIAMPDFSADHRAKCLEQPDGSFLATYNANETLKCGYETPGSTVAPWHPTTVIHVPRNVYVIEAIPFDKYYNYAKMIFYVDPAAGVVQKVIYDRAGEYWKTLLMYPCPYEQVESNGNVRARASVYLVGHTIVDDKSDHASINSLIGEGEGIKFWTKFGDPSLKPSVFSPGTISTRTR